MVAPNDAVHELIERIAEQGYLPDEMSVIFHEADEDNDDSDEDLPLLEVQIDSTDRPQLTNNDLVGHKVDDSGNRIARVYESTYELTLELNIWTAGKTNNDPNEFGNDLRRALYPFSSHGPGLSIDDDIYYIVIGDGAREDDIIQTPTVRKWQQEVELWAVERFSTDEEPIEEIDFPEP